MSDEDEQLLGVSELTPVDMEALEAALALLDDCDPCNPIDSSEAVSSALSLDASRELHAGGVTSKDGGTTITSSSGKRPRKRVREYSPETERIRRQLKKMERAQLQAQVVALEHQLERLRELPQSLAEQVHRRAQAENTNKELLAVLTSSIEGSQRVLRLLSDVSTLDEMIPQGTSNADRDQNRGQDTNDALPRGISLNSRHSHEQLVRDARGTLRRAYLDTDTMLCRLAGASGLASDPDVSRSTSIFPSDDGGACVELTTTTPLNCEVGDAFQLVRDWIVANGHQCLKEIRYSKLDKRFEDPTMEVQSEIRVLTSTKPMLFLSAFAAEKFEEPDRVVLVYTTVTAHLAGAMRFHEHGWISVTRSPLDPLCKSVVRTCYRLTVAQGEPGSIPQPSRLDDVRRLLVQRTDKRLRSLQHELLQSTGHSDICALADA